MNDATLDLSKPVFPFGERPRYGDAFHLASEKTFAPDIASATIRFTLRPYTPAELQTIFGINVGRTDHARRSNGNILRQAASGKPSGRLPTTSK